MKYTIVGNDFRNVPEDMTEEFYEKQLETYYSIFPDDRKMIFHFLKGNVYEIGSTDNINDFIECLAIKEGGNLVQFENGNYGFMATYGAYENGFEIMPLSMPIR